MADQEKWELSREEIERRLQQLKTDPKQKEKTRGGRSSGQGSAGSAGALLQVI